MFKYIMLVISFITFLLFSFWVTYNNQKDNTSNDYSINDILLKKTEKNIGYERSISLPVPEKAKMVNIDNLESSKKMKKTPYTYDSSIKTTIPRLTKEEIEKAPVVDVVKMKMNGESMEMIVVKKDGLTYDASDGVVVFLPGNYGTAFEKYR